MAQPVETAPFERRRLSTRLDDRVTLSRWLCFAAALSLAFGSVAFYRQWTVAIDLWNVPDQAMTFRYFASFIIAFAGALLWVGVTGEIAALSGISLTVVAGAAALGVYFAGLAIDQGEAGYLPPALLMSGLLVAGVVVVRWTRSWPDRRPAPQPRGVRIAFSIFTVLLVITGIACLRRIDNVFPWDLAPRWSTQIGLLLLASAVYFAHGLVRGGWTHAGSQLAGFLAYDLVLAIPYGRMLIDRDDPAGPYGAANGGSGVNDWSLAVVIVVISTSALIAIWYLFVDHRTRMTGNRTPG